jgi:secreted trypsin-like serine protease
MSAQLHDRRSMSRTPTARLLTAGITAVVVTSALFAGAVGIANAHEPAPVGPIHPTIVGGSEATTPYPFMASLQLGDDIPLPEGGVYRKGTHVCGASLISPTWLVTADHCVLGWKPKDLQLRLGSLNRFAGGTVVRPKRFVSHSKLGDPSYRDLALIELTKPAKEAPVVVGAAAPTGSRVRLLGWGRTCSSETTCTRNLSTPGPTIPDPSEDTVDAPLTLRQVANRILPDRTCADIQNATELCVGEVGRVQGACYGDSGGPALIDRAGHWTLVGATSRGTQESCASSPTIYTDVTAARTWITKVTGVR